MNWEKKNKFNDLLSSLNFKNDSDIEWCFGNEKNQNLMEWMMKNISISNFLSIEEIRK
jgi:hypothetical protein